ncbi:mucin-5AC [Drosophila sulfurigaster albostrigata]|uniref:mucin-5AC n=1 Tax=Drosophila sulfurigaster albostrigata TaxID=89887 RepID=UPI002D21A985|nr:mucin-5AC [Drosophila sulfurigaster albostrigata]
MHNTKSHLIVASALLLLFAAPACFADLMCYVCDNCQTVDKNTPLLACNEDFFNQGGSTEASTVTTTMSTMTTTDEPTTIMPTTETPTTMPSDSTTVMDTTTTEQPTTDTTAAQTTEKTDAPMPTPATVGPPETTTSVPTPPNEDLLREVTKLVAVNGSPSGLADFTELPIRQRRALIDTNVSFHCYTVKKTVNNTAQTERGCSRVLASQSVCTDLREQSAPLEISYCDPCSMNACNSATSMMHTTMLSTFLIVLVAVVLQRK